MWWLSIPSLFLGLDGANELIAGFYYPLLTTGTPDNIREPDQLGIIGNPMSYLKACKTFVDVRVRAKPPDLSVGRGIPVYSVYKTGLLPSIVLV